MSDFIKQNWFKITVAVAILIVALSVGYYFSIYVPQRNNLVLQEDCSKRANEIFMKNTGEYAKTYQGYTYTNHYNKKMSKCFVLIYGGDWTTEYHATMYNAYDNKELGGIHTAGKFAGLCGLEINGSYKACEDVNKEGRSWRV
jgi:hypothetical protein